METLFSRYESFLCQYSFQWLQIIQLYTILSQKCEHFELASIFFEKFIKNGNNKKKIENQ